MKGPQIVFRVEGHPECGYGHFFRCFELAKSLREQDQKVDIAFWGHYSSYAKALLEKTDFTFRDETKPNNFTLEKSEVFNEQTLLIIDSYIPKQDYYQFLTEQSIKWGVFDDFADLDFQGGLFVINFRVDADKLYTYKSKNSYCGPKYMPIRRSLTELRVKRDKQDHEAEIEHVLIFLGGRDLHNKSFQLALWMHEVMSSLKITIISDELDPAEEQKNWLEIVPIKESFEDYMQNADIVIAGGGRFKYESCYALIPTFSVSQTEEQELDSVELAQRDLIVNAGLVKNIDETFFKDRFRQVLEKIARKKLVENCRVTFDLDSSSKIAKEVLGWL